MTDTPSSEIAACSLVDVEYRYGVTNALRGVSLRVAPGESVALIGPSGAGKTTLLRVIAGLFQPSAGAVEVMGRSLAGLRPGRELAGLVGMMQQQLDLVLQLAVKHNVQAGYLGRWGTLRSLAALAFPIESTGARNAIRRVGLEDRIATRVGRLSGGEQQRVALARLLVQDPDLVLADEPVSALDPALADDLLALLRDLVSDRPGERPGESMAPRALIASVHQPELALRHFDRIIAMRSGQIAFDKPADDVTEKDLDLVYSLVARAPTPEPAAAGQ